LEYDKSREAVQHNANTSAFDQDNPFRNDPLEDDWSIAAGFYPNIKSEYEDLKRISWRLALLFGFNY